MRAGGALFVVLMAFKNNIQRNQASLQKLVIIHKPYCQLFSCGATEEEIVPMKTADSLKNWACLVLNYNLKHVVQTHKFSINLLVLVQVSCISKPYSHIVR